MITAVSVHYKLDEKPYITCKYVHEHQNKRRRRLFMSMDGRQMRCSLVYELHISEKEHETAQKCDGLADASPIFIKYHSLSRYAYNIV